MTTPTTLDAFLSGKIHLHQPTKGFRGGSDGVLLAAAIPAQGDERILDVGCGVGTAMFCLAARVKNCKIRGLELQEDLVTLGKLNIQENDFQERCQILQGSIQSPPEELSRGSFHHVLSNPPYFEKAHMTDSPYETKTLSHGDSECDLKAWVNFCVSMARPKGNVTFIFTAERLPYLLALMQEQLGDIVIFPLWPKLGSPCKRVIVSGKKDSKKGCYFSPGLVLHQDSGPYTTHAQSILRDGQELNLRS